ncbi:MAG: phage tail protein [Mucilaginibacter sp.]
MEGTIGEVRIFAATFAPRTWAYCQGQLLAIRSNTALFSILGTQYGGDGVTTFALPNLASRAMVGTGQGPGLSQYDNGDMTGTENVTLLQSELPAHTHATTVTPGTGGTGQATLNGVNGLAGQAGPGGGLIGQDTTHNVSMFASSGTPVAMDSGSIVVTKVQAQPVTGVTLAPAGSTLPHNNIQPSLALNYIICMQGVFPSRN